MELTRCEQGTKHEGPSRYVIGKQDCLLCLQNVSQPLQPPSETIYRKAFMRIVTHSNSVPFAELLLKRVIQGLMAVGRLWTGF